MKDPEAKQSPFNRDRMEKALDGGSGTRIPDGLTKNELRDFILSTEKSLPEEQDNNKTGNKKIDN